MKNSDWLTTIREEVHVRPRKTLAEEAADNLREFILLEKLAPGTAISEVELADALGISRTPLREALRLLEIEGLVEYTSTRRARVADPSLEELSKYIKVLGALEALAGELACEQASDADITEIVALGREMEEGVAVNDPLTSFRLDMAFHARLVEASRNEPLIETHRQYNARLWRARFISSRRKTRRDTTLMQHDHISEALQRRDKQAVAHALRAHLDTTILNIRGVFEKNKSSETTDK